MKKFSFTILSFVFCSSVAFAQSWNITGNSGTAPASNFVGTTDNKALVFRTNNIENLRITSDGKVGIGTASPSGSKLQVIGNTRMGSSANYVKVDTSGILSFAGTGVYRIGGNK